MNRAAAWKSEDQLNSLPLSHDDSLGRNTWERLADCDYTGGVGEIIAWGFSSPQSVFTAWMTSSGHYARIVDPRPIAMGLGRAGTSWTVDFGVIADGGSGSAPAPTSPPPPTASATATAAPTQQPAPPTAAPTSQSSPPTPGATAPSVQGASVALSAGFNFVTYAGQRQLTSSAFDSLEGVELWVYGWDEHAKAWERFFSPGPDYLNTLMSVEPGRAYMIWVSRPAVWEY